MEAGGIEPRVGHITRFLGQRVYNRLTENDTCCNDIELRCDESQSAASDAADEPKKHPSHSELTVLNKAGGLTIGGARFSGRNPDSSAAAAKGITVARRQVIELDESALRLDSPSRGASFAVPRAAAQ